jgi:hypothetical protein
MIVAKTGHLVIATQTNYMLVRLTALHQLEISKVYSICNSPTQLDDTTILILFSTLAAVGKVETYSTPTISVWRVNIPEFPTWVFQPYQGIFRDGARQQQTEFCKSPKSFFLPLRWLGLEGEVQSDDNEVTIAFGQLLLFFFAARVVIKAAHSAAAAQRLDREFLAYSTLHAWQGVAILRVFGLYTGTDQTTKVLLMSDAGKALWDFSDLEPADK